MAGYINEVNASEHDSEADSEVIAAKLAEASKIYSKKIENKNLTPFEKYKDLDLEKLHTFKMSSGKWKGHTFYNVYTTQNDYVRWALDNVGRISDKSTMFLFVHYCHRLLNLV